jgi:hypothetical protein
MGRCSNPSPSRFEYEAAVRFACDLVMARIRQVVPDPLHDGRIQVTDNAMYFYDGSSGYQLEHSNRSDADALFRIALSARCGSRWARHRGYSVFRLNRAFLSQLSAGVSKSAQDLPNRVFGSLVYPEGPLLIPWSVAIEVGTGGIGSIPNGVRVEQDAVAWFGLLLVAAVASNLQHWGDRGVQVQRFPIRSDTRVTIFPDLGELAEEFPISALLKAVVHACSKGWLEIELLWSHRTSFRVQESMVEKIRQRIRESYTATELLAAHVIPEEYIKNRDQYALAKQIT